VPAADKQLDHRIEIQIRSQMNIPADFGVKIGARTKSEFAGYDKLPVTFSHNTATQTVDFYISSDNKTLIRMSKIDLSHDPSELVSVKDRPFRGGADAKVTIVNFDDLECPFCARMHRELFPETLARYGDKVKIVYKDFPLLELHPWALHAAVDANCLAAQNVDAYWAFVDHVHDHGSEITGESRDLSASDAALDKLAREQAVAHKLNAAALDTCLSAQDTTKIKASMAEGSGLGVEATPTLYINGERLEGAEGTDKLWPAIDRALTEAGVTPPPPAAKPPATGPAIDPPTSKPQGQ
jgi:protein-disulfide isomerase